MESSGKYIWFIARLYWWTIIALAIASMLVPKGVDVIWINGHHTVFLDEFFKLITNLGQGWIFIPVLAVSFFIRYSISLSTVAMAALNGIVCVIVKRVLCFHQFPRPVALLNNELLYFVPGVQVHLEHSFPSGHSATIFCFAVIASILVRHRIGSVLILVVALLVGYSRIYLLQHFLLDVTAGALVGVGTAFSILYLFDRMNLPQWSSTNLSLKLRKV